MNIVEPDFTMKPCSSDSSRFDLIFNKRVKKRDTNEYAIEPGDPLYGLTLSTALIRIAHHRTAKKYEEANISLKEFLKEYQLAYREIVKLCRESLPEKFDTGE